MTALRMVRGDTPEFKFVVLASDLPGASAFNLTSCDVTFTAKYEQADLDGDAVFQRATGGSGITVTDAANGKLTVRLSADDTSGLTEETTLQWDLQVEDSSGGIMTPARGTLLVLADITRGTSS